jgi:anti-sigma factor RsiW
MEGLTPDRCPVDPEEVAELYCLDRLSPEDRQVFEEHYIGCPQCAEAVQKSQEYVDAMRDAARRIRRKGGAA